MKETGLPKNWRQPDHDAGQRTSLPLVCVYVYQDLYYKKKFNSPPGLRMNGAIYSTFVRALSFFFVILESTYVLGPTLLLVFTFFFDNFSFSLWHFYSRIILSLILFFFTLPFLLLLTTLLVIIIIIVFF